MNQETNIGEDIRGHAPALTFLFLASVGLYCRTLSADFTNWDDLYLVVRNPAIRSLSVPSILQIFSQFFLNHYHPLVIVSFALDHAIDGLNPFYFHLTNIILNALNGCLAFLVAIRLSRNQVIAFVTAGFFAAHPVHVEAVAWISARKDLLCTLFYFSAILWYIRTRTHSAASWLVTGILFLLALLSKATAVTLPFALLGLDYYYNSAEFKLRSVAAKTSLLLLSVVFSIVAIKAQYSTGTVWSGVQLTTLEHLFLPLYDLSFYAFTFVAPVNLSPFYPYPTLTGEQFPVLFWLSPLLVAAATTLFVRIKPDRLTTTAMGFFVLSIIPTLQILPVGRAIAADRFLYLPSFGLCLATAVAFNKFSSTVPSKALRIVYAVAAIFVASLGYLTFRQAEVWQDSFSLWHRVIHQYPSFAEAHSKLGVALVDVDDLVGARDEFTRAIALNPQSPEFYFNRANANHTLRDTGSALADVDSAIAHSYGEGPLFQLRGQILFEQRNYRGAITEFDRALRVNGGLMESHINRGFAYLNLGLPDSARMDVQWGIAKGFRFDESILRQVGLSPAK